MHFDKRKIIYKCIFYLSAMCILIKKNPNQSQRQRKYLCYNMYKAIDIILNGVIFLFTTFSLFNSSNSLSLKMLLVILCLLIIYISFRISLLKCLNELPVFTRKLSNIPLRTHKTSQFPNWIFVWISFITCLNFFVFMRFVEEFTIPDKLKLLILNYEIDDVFLRAILSFIYSYFSIIILYMPLNIFSIFYVMICHEIEAVILNFRHSMKKYPRCTYKELNITYSKIKSVVDHVDSNAGFLILISIFFYGILLCTILSMLISLERFDMDLFNMATLCTCANGISNYLATTLSASKIHEASLSVKSQSKRFQEKNFHSVCSYMLFLHNCDEEISMTLWRILSIKRNVVLGIFGTMLTYALLFDNVFSKT